MTTIKVHILFWLITLFAQVHGVDPEFAKAVAIVESRLPGKATLRTGRLGRSKFFGPMGVHQCFLKKWPIDNPVWNIYVGVRALRGRPWRKVLHRYNPEATPAYIKAVRSVWRGLEGE